MSRAEDILRLRTAAALSRLEGQHFLRFRGDGCYEALNHVYARDIYLRDGELSHGVLLDTEAHVMADCYLASDDEAFFLVADVAPHVDLLAHISQHTSGIGDVEVVEETAGVRFLAVDGPYAWEVMVRLVGQEVIGLPYLSFFRFDGAICYRAGRTGEYGYVLIVPAGEAESMWERLVHASEGVDATVVGADVLDQCALEGWFFNIHREGRGDVTPLELQLQWRTSRQKTFVGSEALARGRARGITRRLTCLRAEGPVRDGDILRRNGAQIGTLCNAGHSPTLEAWVALALVDLEYAVPGIEDLRVGEDRVPAGTVRPPVVNNRSLYVNPQVHSYATRAETDFPDLRP